MKSTAAYAGMISPRYCRYGKLAGVDFDCADAKRRNTTTVEASWLCHRHAAADCPIKSLSMPLPSPGLKPSSGLTSWN
jgi:hypothetical protein